jgi:hypothetical protein
VTEPARTRTATLADLLAIPEDRRRHELIDGYVEVLIAERHELVRAEPFDAIQLRVAVLFGEDDDE